MKIKLAEPEISLTTLDALNGASVVRIFNGQASTVTITRADATDTTIGTCSMPAGSIQIFEKEPTDKLGASLAVSAVKIAYTS